MAPAQHAPAPAPKKGKGKKAPDPSEQQKQIQAKIAQLELDAAGNKEEELEIGGLPLQYDGQHHVESCRLESHMHRSYGRVYHGHDVGSIGRGNTHF